MIPSFSNVHNKFRLNGYGFNHNELKDAAYNFVNEGKPFEKSVGSFLLNWLDNNDFIIAKTSGSTGKPKTITLKKQAMVNSAIATSNYFNLEPGNSAIHCLSTEFIAGKMMLVRAIVLGLEIDLVEPSLNPLLSVYKEYDFCAMVPMQLQNSIGELRKIKLLIVGGATVSYSLEEKIKNLSTKVYATYGMTETITHIAVKQLNRISTLQNKVTYYQTLPNIAISQDERDCLIIDAPNLSKEKIVTNDIIKLHSKTEFEILGRFDNVINSGGVKFFPEQIEAKLQSKIEQRFFIASEKDEILGEKLILILEGESNYFESKVFENLDTYETPKQIRLITHFKESSSGKVLRTETLKLLK